MRTLTNMLAALVVILSCAAASPGVVVYSTFGANDSYTGSSWYTIGPTGGAAMRFTLASDAVFNNIEAALSSSGGAAPLTITIAEDMAGVPGNTPLWSSTHVVDVRAIYPFFGPQVRLTAGQVYWVVAKTESSSSQWYQSSPAIAGTRATISSGNWVVLSGTVAALRLSTVPTGCCNPTTGDCIIIQPETCTSLGLRPLDTTVCSPTNCRVCPSDFDRNGVASIDDLFLFINAYFAGCP